MEKPEEVVPVSGGCVVCGRPAAYRVDGKEPCCWLHKERFVKAGRTVDKKH
jgi:hypothetical protein